jgi:hypothetical protein
MTQKQITMTREESIAATMQIIMVMFVVAVMSSVAVAAAADLTSDPMELITLRPDLSTEEIKACDVEGVGEWVDKSET